VSVDTLGHTYFEANQTASCYAFAGHANLVHVSSNGVDSVFPWPVSFPFDQSHILPLLAHSSVETRTCSLFPHRHGIQGREL